MPPIAQSKIGEVEKAGTLETMIEESGEDPAGVLARRGLELLGRRPTCSAISSARFSGMPFEQFLKQRILDPLGMTDTDFHVPDDKAHRFAACYSADPQGGMTFHADQRREGLTLQDDPAKSSSSSPPSLISGGGGLCSTAADYLTFCRALLNGGELDGVRLLGPKTLTLMTAQPPARRPRPARSVALAVLRSHL